MSGTFELPIFRGKHILLTPKDLLTKDDTWINKSDLYEDFDQIPDAISNLELRAQVNNFFRGLLPRRRSGIVKKTERNAAIVGTIRQFPELIDYYIRSKEDRGDEAVKVSDERVESSQLLFVKQAGELVSVLKSKTSFYDEEPNSYEAALKRAHPKASPHFRALNLTAAE